MLQHALAFGEKLHANLAGTFVNLGVVAEDQHDFAAARDYFERALDIFTKISPNTTGIPTALQNLSFTFYFQGDLYAPDIAMLPIGDHYTMSPREAAYACNLLKPKTVIPMHFGTFPVLTGTPADMKKLAPSVEVLEMKPGVTLS